MTENDANYLLNLIERRNEELASMIEIGKTLTTSLDAHEILASLMRQVERLIKPKSWSLLLVDEATGELTFEVVVSPVADGLKDIRLKRGEGIAGWVAEQGQKLLIPDVSADPRFALHIDQAMGFTTRSIACVPMKIQNRTIGVIELINSYEQVVFNDADLDILSAIADFAAIALENARNYSRISELVITDDLSGLYNSRHFNTLLECEVQRAERYQTELSMVFLDLDHFKSINDTHGHLVGSRILAEFGRLIKNNIRTSDMAARYGGDEFAVVLPHTGRQSAVTMALHLLDILRETVFEADDGQDIRITASFGVASFPEDATSRVELIRTADTAMYEAKAAGRNGVVAYDRDYAQKK